MVQLRNHFALVCNSTELLNKCVCDFRINIRGCEEENLFQEASLILVPYLFITSLTSAAFIFNQVFIKRKSIFYPSRERCFKWIKPKDAFNTVVCVYHLIEAACLLLLINDSYPNSIYAEFFCYLSRLIGYSLAVTIPISLIYSTPESQLYVMNDRRKPNNYLNIFAFWLMVTPFITNVPFSLLTGYYADKNEVSMASRMLMLNSIAWCLWTLQFVVILLYAYYNLVFNMRGYVDRMRRRHADELRIQELQITRKILSWIVRCGAIIFAIHFVETLSFGLLYRSVIIYKKFLNMLYFFLWHFFIPIFTNIVQLIYIY